VDAAEFSSIRGLNWHLNKNVKPNFNHDECDSNGGAATDLPGECVNAIFTRAQSSF